MDRWSAYTESTDSFSLISFLEHGRSMEADTKVCIRILQRNRTNEISVYPSSLIYLIYLIHLVYLEREISSNQLTPLWELANLKSIEWASRLEIQVRIDVQYLQGRQNVLCAPHIAYTRRPRKCVECENEWRNNHLRGSCGEVTGA